MESENNATLIDTLSQILVMFQLLANLQSSSAFFVVPDKDCDIAVEILRTCLVKVCQTLSIGHAHSAKTIALFTLYQCYHLYCIDQNFGRCYSKTIVYGLCINLQADFVGVASSFARICTSRLKVKQKAKIINCRWAGSFGELLVCFAAKLASIS